MRAILFAVLLTSCGGGTPEAPPPAPVVPMPAPVAAPAPVGPDGPADLHVPEVVLSTDAAVIAAGEGIFTAKGCGGCHKFGEKLVGPDLKGVTDRRSPTWIARMVKYPELMTKQDPVAKDLFRTLMVQMSTMNVTDEELTPLISYLASEGKK